MEQTGEWYKGKAKERLGRDFIKSVLEHEYSVMDYGIETHNQIIVKKIAGCYDTDTNKRLMRMPDFVIVDQDTKHAELVEVKFNSRVFVSNNSIYHNSILLLNGFISLCSP